MKDSHPARLPYLVIVLGVILSLYLLYHVRDEVFFSGDGGVKALLVKQYCRGEFSDALKLTSETWVEQTWRKGLYPFGPPFVYDLPRGHVVAFPLLFPIISTPFYALLGFRGLYVIPTVSLWILWIRFVSVARHLDLSPKIIAVSLTLLVFSSPLTLYGAMFWEHTLGVLLLFCGVDFILTSRSRRYGNPTSLMLGILAGLSVWVRSEALCMIIALALAAVFLVFKHHLRSGRLFILGMALSVLSLWATNVCLYGHPLSAHSFQVFESRSAMLNLPRYYALVFRLFLYLPASFFILLYSLVLYFERKDKAPSTAYHILFLCLFFSLVVPLALPNAGGSQWGPRYLLILVPLLCLLCGILLKLLITSTHGLPRHLLLSAFAVCAVCGIYLNSYAGPNRLARDYKSRVKPALDFIRQHGSEYVAVNRQWIAHELEAAFESKTFFLVRSNDDLQTLATSLLDQGHPGFLLITYPGDPLAEEIGFGSVDSQIAVVKRRTLGDYGMYAIHDWQIVKKE